MVSITMPVATLAAGGLAAGGAALAGSMQAGAASDATNAQRAMYTQTRNDLQPFIFNGQQAFTSLAGMLGWNPDWTAYNPANGPAGGGSSLSVPNTSSMLSNLQNYPGYQFALDQGVQALDRSAAARGSLLSGGTLKDLTAYGQGMGSQLFDNYWNKVAGLTSIGENAAAGAGNAGTAAGQGIASSLMSGGTAAASGLTGAINNLTSPSMLQSAFQAYQSLNTPMGPSQLAPPSSTYTGYNPNAGYQISPYNITGPTSFLPVQYPTL